MLSISILSCSNALKGGICSRCRRGHLDPDQDRLATRIYDELRPSWREA